jgi:phosphoglycolate phosphatase-like HAD superfamily hydrolase
VATGIFSSDELSPHQPDVLLEDLTDLAAVLQSLGL